MSAPDDDGEVWTDQVIVCLGACSLTGGKRGLNWRVPGGEDFALERKAIKGGVGEMWTVPANSDLTRFKTGGAKYVKLWTDPADLAAWRVRNDAHMAMERERALHKQGKTDALEKSLSGLYQLRKAWQMSDKWGRTVIEALALQYLRGGS